MTRTARVSVCIPTYNGAAFIAEALSSVLAQSFTDFELLVVDDGSNDGTLEILRSFTDERLHIHQNERRLGIPGNWNRCVALARGEYLTIFHQDDMMLPDNLSRKIQLLTHAADVGFVHSAIELARDGSAPTNPREWVENAQADFIVEGCRYFRKLLFHENCICAPTVVTRREALLALGGFDENLSYACDYEMWMKLCVENRVGFLAQPLVRYRWHEKNASHLFRFGRGEEENALARLRALDFYRAKQPQSEECEIVTDAALALQKVRARLEELERYKVWLEQQVENWRGSAEERGRWAETLEQGKTWLEQQVQAWKATAAERGQRAEALEQSHSRLEQELNEWQSAAAERLPTLVSSEPERELDK
ncbi:MAG: glycosyltransferase [Deltaproteobacteria bacterium]|nr:glycosyltransferase [Deltaproteobacteria bacterium]